MVVGFHGAGFKHIILCPRHTLVLELTLLLAPAAAASTTIWRSNEEVGRLHGHVVWQTHALDPAEALPGWPAPADLFGSGSTRGDYERATLVRVPSRDVLNLANVVRAHVRQACAVPGGGNDGRPSGACTWAVRRLGP